MNLELNVFPLAFNKQLVSNRKHSDSFRILCLKAFFLWLSYACVFKYFVTVYLWFNQNSKALGIGSIHTTFVVFCWDFEMQLIFFWAFSILLLKRHTFFLFVATWSSEYNPVYIQNMTHHTNCTLHPKFPSKLFDIQMICGSAANRMTRQLKDHCSPREPFSLIFLGCGISPSFGSLLTLS